MPKIIDSFMFNDELFPILDLRLNILNPVVDHFVICEANVNQRGVPKPYYFEKNKHLFPKFLDKIIHVKMDNLKQDGQWGIENSQRNGIQIGLDKLDLQDEDVCVTSDVDEIWNPLISKTVDKWDLVAAEMDYFTYFLNLKTENKWVGSVFAKVKIIKEHNLWPQSIRNLKNNIARIPQGGHHFGYMGGKNAVYKKFNDCCEPFNQRGIPNKEEFDKLFNERCCNDGNFLFIDSLDNKSIKLKKVEIDNSYPEYLVKNQSHYKDYIL